MQMQLSLQLKSLSYSLADLVLVFATLVAKGVMAAYYQHLCESPFGKGPNQRIRSR